MMGFGKKPNQVAETLHCSFCAKSQHEVRKMIAGPTVYICDECVWLCVDIIEERQGGADSKAAHLGRVGRAATP